MMDKLKKLKWNHYINYVVIGIFTLVFSIISLAGGHLAWQAILQAVMAWLYIVW